MHKVLIAENNPTITKLLSHFFEAEGCDIRLVEDGLQAMITLDTFVPDILCTDIIMPKIGGDQLCRIIRQTPRFKNIFIVVYSAISLEEDKHLFDMEADLYIAKGTSVSVQKHVRLVIDQFSSGKRRGNILHGTNGLYSRTITKELLLSKRHDHIIFENLAEAVIEMNETGQIIRANRAAQELLGHDVPSLLGCRLTEHLSGPEYILVQQWITKVSKGGSSHFRSSYEHPLLIGKNKILLKLVRVAEHDEFFIIAILQDITGHKKTETELVKVLAMVSDLANRDVLTGLPNLRLCQERFLSTLSMSKRKGWQAAIMFVDLDGFKNVNDSFGHEAGDRILKMVAQRLVKIVRKADTVARIGGDEFLIIQTEVNDKAAAAHVASKILQQLAAPFDLDGNEIKIGASIGIAMYPAHGDNSRDLIRKADNAMYKTKTLGKGGYSFAPD